MHKLNRKRGIAKEKEQDQILSFVFPRRFDLRAFVEHSLLYQVSHKRRQLDVDKITQTIKSSVTTTLLDQTPKSFKN